ncbi:uncharacterized protein LOC129322418 [Prosopis cineraria]|uniref:uncharacterized protein LOC129322418 n=1 Tax=Prosopis cineraria TaxID=364024 RepID=UPI00240F5A7C|nr:uncharacterized protein LOC129322418 [Prosopis cineraria]
MGLPLLMNAQVPNLMKDKRTPNKEKDGEGGVHCIKREVSFSKMSGRVVPVVFLGLVPAGLEYLHMHQTPRIIHGDLKPGNIAPEYHQTVKFPHKSDICSFGVVLGNLVMRMIPSDASGSEDCLLLHSG